MRLMLAVLCLSAAAVSTAGAQVLLSPPSSTQGASLPTIALPPELDRVLRDYERAWRARDAAALAMLFTEDGMVLPSGRPPARGRAAIQEAYARSGGPLSLRALHFVAEDTVAWIVGAYAGERGAPDQGKFVLALRRRQGRGPWLIAADIDNANRRPGAPAEPPPDSARRRAPPE